MDQAAMTRSEFLRGGWWRALAGVTAAVRGGGARAPRPPARPVPAGWVRPPGALDEPAFLAACTRCDGCVQACPHLAIRKAGPELGAALAGTPVLKPDESPCLYCDGLPCIAACDDGALVAGLERPAIGVIRIAADVCYQAQRQPCDYCAVRCPERPRAVSVGMPGAVPAVNMDRCTGCGVCAQICPAGAISVADCRPSGISA